MLGFLLMVSQENFTEASQRAEKGGAATTPVGVQVSPLS